MVKVCNTDFSYSTSIMDFLTTVCNSLKPKLYALYPIDLSNWLILWKHWEMTPEFKLHGPEHQSNQSQDSRKRSSFKGQKICPSSKHICSQIIQWMGPSQLLQVLSFEFLNSVSDFSKFSLSWNSSNLMLCAGTGRKGVLQGWIPSH